jgi:hypothetical protein
MVELLQMLANRACRAGPERRAVDPQLARHRDRQREQRHRARPIREPRPTRADPPEETVHERRHHERPGDGRREKSCEEDREVPKRRMRDAERSEGTADRGPVREMLRVRERQEQSGGQAFAPVDGRRFRETELVPRAAPRVDGEPHEVN